MGTGPAVPEQDRPVEIDKLLPARLRETALGRDEAAFALPVVRSDLPDVVRRRLLAAVDLAVALGAPITPVVPTPPADADRAAILADLSEDEQRHWRSPWLRACALYEARDAVTVSNRSR